VNTRTLDLQGLLRTPMIVDDCALRAVVAANKKWNRAVCLDEVRAKRIGERCGRTKEACARSEPCSRTSLIAAS